MNILNKHQILKRILNYTVIMIITFSLFSCICRKDKIDSNEGRELYDLELKVIPYEEGDTIKFVSNNEIHYFICSYREHYYDKGQPTSVSNDPCLGKRLMSKDILKLDLMTDLTTYNYQYGSLDKVDSANIYLKLKSDYFEDEFSILSFSIQGGQFYVASLLYLFDNEIIYREDHRPTHTSYDYYDFTYRDTITINDMIYEKVIHFENHYPINDNVPYYFSKLFYNEEFGIIRLMRSDGVIYDRFENK